jgi:hypothetical protein
MHYTLLGYATSFIILFTNFYIHAYVKGRRQGGRKAVTSKATANGAPPQIKKKL